MSDRDYYIKILDTEMVGDCSELHRHWCERSEKIAGADALLTVLQGGYSISGQVICQAVFYNGRRYSEVYHFRLINNEGHIVDMPVLRNPFVMRLIRRLKLSVYRDSNSLHVTLKSRKNQQTMRMGS